MKAALAIFTKHDLETWVDAQAFRRGVTCFKNGGVGPATVTLPNPGTVRLAAMVDDGSIYPQTTYLEWDGQALRARCDCPLGTRCRHAVALGLAFLDQPAALGEIEQRSVSTSLVPGQDVILYGLWPAPPPKKLESLYSRAICLWLALDLSRLREDCTPAGSRPLALWGAPPSRDLSAEDLEILELVTPFFRQHGREFSSPHARGIPLLENLVNPVMRLLARRPFVFGGGRKPVTIHPDQPLTHRKLSAWEGDEGVWELDGRYLPVAPSRLFGEDPAWVMLEDSFHPVEEGEALEGPLPSPETPTEGQEAPARPTTSVTHPQVSPTPRLTLHEEGDRLLVRLSFGYGAAAPINPADPRKAIIGEYEGQWGFFQRDSQSETRFLKRLSEVGLDARGDGEWTAWGDPALGFLMDAVPELLEEEWLVFGEEQLANLKVDRRRASISVGITTGMDWFDVETRVSLEGSPLDAALIREALRTGSRFVKLGTGGYARLPEEWLSRQRSLSEALGFDSTLDGASMRQRLPRYQALAAGELLEVADEGSADRDWRAFVNRLQDFSGIPEQPIPEGFAGELRGYQRRGLDYLCFLRDSGLNGILADDMGLGKTIQAIALLLREKAAGRTAPSLLVAPTSVVYNWAQELGRFAPDLKTLVLHGSDRQPLFARIDECDVIITSYSLLRRDFERLRQHAFNYVVLDEAQMIKNPRSQAAKAACRLNGEHRLCLTGTPIENNLMELWSLFQFLMPGYLGSEKRFRQTYLASVDTEEQRASLEPLRRKTRPFILRRLKQEVATDLPPRSEIVSFCELGADQRRFYDELLSQVRMEVLGTVDRLGLAKSHFNVLEGLLRLRQACCDPQLIHSNAAHVPSAKVELFMELVQEVVEGGHRVLVFSQFVKVLQILERRLKAEGMDYMYLDGQTKDRLERVEKFNSGTTPVFLISLKAGGTGLNLTGADYVIHFDPWWNPAVEDQATDRAHRIGQTRHVFSYKLIAKDTVEEKVLALQVRKRQMVKDVLGGEEMARSLSREDLEYLFS